jgi:hypothetical protein
MHLLFESFVLYLTQFIQVVVFTASCYYFGISMFGWIKRKELFIKAFSVYPLYCLTRVPISIQGFLNRRKKVWNHTVHTRNISINELEQSGQALKTAREPVQASRYP